MGATVGAATIAAVLQDALQRSVDKRQIEDGAEGLRLSIVYSFRVNTPRINMV